MSEKRDREKTKTKSSVSKQLLTESPGNCLMDVVTEFHSYSAANADVTPLPESNSSTPNPKKVRSEPSLLELQDNIVRMVSAKIRESTDSLAQMITRNTSSINDLKEHSRVSFPRNSRYEERSPNSQNIFCKSRKKTL